MEWPCMSTGKRLQHMPFSGVGHGGRAYEGCQGQGGISLQRWNLVGVESVEYMNYGAKS